MSNEERQGVQSVEGHIQQCIHVIRSCKVMLDQDLAALYQVENRTLLQSTQRNLRRFPEDFMFQLTKTEWDCLRSQFVISKGRGGRRYPPYVFTEQGVAMLSSVLRSKRAIEVNIQIMRTSVHLRQLLATHENLARKLEELEQHYDGQFHIVFEAIRQLVEPADEPRRRIGFH